LRQFLSRIEIGTNPFAEEKIRYEAETMRYVAAHTTIPVPRVYRYGTAAENPTGLGPFIIMDWVEHHQNMSRALLDPTRPPQDRPVLDPSIGEAKLEKLYRQMANILLQLHALRFPRIGSLAREQDNEDGDVNVKGRPLIQSMSHLVLHNNAPASSSTVLPPPERTYDSASEWFCALADMQMAALALQRNDCVDDAEDARDKYVARQLLRNLAGDDRLVTAGDDAFRLFSEDLRPANVLLDEDANVVGVIDWEFAYVAPTQFSYDPPWWLLLLEPEDWKHGEDGNYKEWMKTYEPRLQTFLRVLKEEEQELSVSGGGGSEKQIPLSQRMKESWDSGAWMVNYAVRKIFSFDYVWWMFLDERFFGPNKENDYHARVGLLTDTQREIMEEFVERKMREKEEGELGHWNDKDATAVLKKVLV
jgi:hypothetical protein